ncbi:unnamed protein product [Larinioides sclopetarius]|uniref:Carboxypeptidase activation peptide domain-containing protein n=1 Tax=Larinioides sclopetarius TaxID=280406 RepID=A0AAV2BGG6_9ARAC
MEILEHVKENNNNHQPIDFRRSYYEKLFNQPKIQDFMLQFLFETELRGLSQNSIVLISLGPRILGGNKTRNLPCPGKERHRLYGLFASDEEELNLLRELNNHPELDVWNEPIALYEKVNVRVPPTIANKLEEEWKKEGIDYYVVADDIQKWIDEEREENPTDDALAGRQENFQLDVYHTFEAVSEQICITRYCE